MAELIPIRGSIYIAEHEFSISAVRAQGPGGQHVNKTSTAIHLRFDIKSSSLPDAYKQRLLSFADHRITSQGVIVIKSQSSRSQEFNKQQAIQGLVELILKATQVQKKRRATKPTKASVQRRLTAKSNRKNLKENRKKVRF